MKIDYSKITYIPCSKTDEDFKTLRSIHRLCMEGSITETLGQWDDEFQEKRLRRHFDLHGDTLNFVHHDGELVGTINHHSKRFLEDDNEIEVNFVEQLYIKPEYQGNGLGSHILEAFTQGDRTRLSVLKNSDKVIGFYHKNGYEQYAIDDYQVFLEVQPSPSKQNRRMLKAA